MQTKFGFRNYFSFILFAVFLLIPSADTILKYGKIPGLIAYLLVTPLLLWVIIKYLLPVFLSKVTEKQAQILAVITFAVLSLMVFFIYPIANSGRFGGGTDVDDQLVITVHELLKGNYPFYLKTYLGLNISAMPGAIFLSIPFVLLNMIAFQNIFWLAVLFITARHYLKSTALVVALFWIFTVFSPTVMQNLVTGSDYLANTIYILIPMWLMIKIISDPDAPLWKKLLPAILLGVGLSSRSNFLLLIPLLFSALIQNAGWKEAIKYLTVSGVVCLLITVPFWLYDPAGFAPLNSQSLKLIMLETVLPDARIIIPAASGLLAIGLSFQKMDTDCVIFLRNCAIVQIFILLVMLTIFSIYSGKLDLSLNSAGYGLFTLFFGILAGWIAFKENEGDLIFYHSNQHLKETG